MHDKRTVLLAQFRDYFDRDLSPAYKRQLLTLLARHLPERGISAITQEDVIGFFREGARTWSLSYLRKVHGAAVVFFYWAERTRRLPINPMRDSPRAIDYLPERVSKPEPDLFVEFADYLRALSRTEDTILQRIGDIKRFTGELDPLQATPQMLGDYLRQHQLDWSQEYRRKIRSSFVIFYGWAVRAGYLDLDPTHSLQSIRPGKPPRSPIEESDLFEGFYSAGLEEQAIIALAASLGLRRKEITVLHTRDRKGRIITVHGKGDRVRMVPLNDLCYELLIELERKQGTGFYFRNHRTGHHLHPSTIYKHAKAHIGSWCLHSLRHRAATIGLRRGANLRQIQELLGHLSLTTTQIYAAVTMHELEQVTSTTSWPKNRSEATKRSAIVTLDLENLSESDVSCIADALSRHLGKLNHAA